MTVQLPRELVELLADPESLKALATVDESGTPHVVVNNSLHLAEDGNILLLELHETSRTNHNLVRAIWFEQKVSIAVTGAGQKSYQIKGRPIRVHVTGPLYQKHYRELRRHLGDVDLSGVWVIEPLEVINEHFLSRQREEEKKHPFFRHLDRLSN